MSNSIYANGQGLFGTEDTVIELMDIMDELQIEVKAHYLQWIIFLTQGIEKNVEQVINLYREQASWGNAIMEYRKQVREDGRGDVDNELIINSYQSNNMKVFKSLLSEKCLECLTDKDIELIVECLHNRGWGIDKLIKRLDRDTGRRVMSLVL